MSGFFGVASKSDCVMHLFFGIDYHSHLGTKRGGMVVYGEDGFQRSIHNIESSPFALYSLYSLINTSLGSLYVGFLFRFSLFSIIRVFLLSSIYAFLWSTVDLEAAM